MRKISYIMGLALALSVGAAGVSAAQAPDRPRGENAGGRRGAPDQLLLRGITLSADQQARVESLREEQRKEFEAERAQRGNAGTFQRGDTTGMGARRAQNEARRDKTINALRDILDSQQRVQFDQNVAEMKAHAGERGPGRRPDGNQ
jgi:Spy/CpxP family protein refolding chaperone